MDSSDAKAVCEGSNGEISDLAEVEAAAFDDPSTATFKSENISQRLSKKKRREIQIPCETCMGKIYLIKLSFY